MKARIPRCWWPAFLLGLSLFVSACGNGPGTSRLSEQQVKAQAMFAERCKTAGEKIYKVVENVEGIYLLKLRPDGINRGDQFTLDDPYGSDLSGERYIVSLLKGSYEHNLRSSENSLPPNKGYAYVEAIDTKDGKRYRYTGAKKAVRKKDVNAPAVQFELKRNPSYDLNIYEFVLEKTPVVGPVPRYGVTYDDISTREEREHWIAGSSLKVIDLQTDEVIAERVGYMLDWAQGSSVAGRAPWLMAADNACPSFAPRHGFTAQRRQTQRFVEKVLKPSTN
ncbi:hypothetical protein [Variovorax sp. JS1663]|uniref:hypothetical protein n=1 Tax=Variovorax sp. JS1663 TaxID=1851577 RepID=UPI00117D822B|nr:hypothetical protein [Variovorax sp. JS1663]